MTDAARFLKKYFCSSNLGPTSLNQAQNEVVCHFLEFGSLDFLEIAYSDSLQQCLTSSIGETHTHTKIGDQNLGQNLGFPPFSQVWVIRFLLNWIG